MTTARRAFGDLGERLAVQHLEANGYEVVDRNYRRAEGEIDIIARSGDTLAFIEVKARRGALMGRAVESLSPRKQLRMLELAEAYDPERNDLPEGRRIDLIAIDFTPDGRLLSLEHYENVVTGDDSR